MAFDFKSILRQQIEAWDEMADQLDRWSEQSRSGGWSTHQCEPQTRKADECRRKAAQLRGTVRFIEAE